MSDPTIHVKAILNGSKPQSTECPYSDETLYRLIISQSPDPGFRYFLNKSSAEPMLIQYFLRRDVDFNDAQDLVQETLLAFFINLRDGRFNFQGEGSLVRYLFGVARNQWLKAVYSQRRRCEHISTVDCTACPPADYDNTPEETDFADYKEQSLMRSFNRMDERSRKLLWGYHVEGESYQDLARELGMKTWRVACQQTHRKRIELRNEVNCHLSVA